MNLDLNLVKKDSLLITFDASSMFLGKKSSQGPSINDVTALVGGGIKDFNSTKAFLLKSVRIGGEGVKNYQKLRDVIYGRSLKLV